jgi:hypothetical protein
MIEFPAINYSEGAATILCGFLAYFTIVDSIASAKFLTPEEREWLVYRKSLDSGSAGEAAEVSRQFIVAALTNWQVWLSTAYYMSIVVPTYSIGFFLPTSELIHLSPTRNSSLIFGPSSLFRSHSIFWNIHASTSSAAYYPALHRCLCSRISLRLLRRQIQNSILLHRRQSITVCRWFHSEHHRAITSAIEIRRVSSVLLSSLFRLDALKFDV